MQTLKEPEFKIIPAVKEEIIKIVDERIREAYVTKEDFSELKGLVRELAIRAKELAEAQRASELRLTKLEQVVGELAEAQRASELRLTKLEQVVGELAEAQKASEVRLTRLEAVIEELAKKITILADGLEITRQELKLTRGEVGGLARSFGYAFENEAYRMLPKTLKEKYGIELTEKLIRTEIEDTEINIIGFGKRNSTEVIVIGEVKARLERMQVFDELAEKVRVVKEKYKNKEIVKVLVTHFATKNILKVASDTGIIVVQSFEW